MLAKIFYYYIPVNPDESDYLLQALCSDLAIADQGAEWMLYTESMSGDTSILIKLQRPLSIIERRKIVSCGLVINPVCEG